MSNLLRLGKNFTEVARRKIDRLQAKAQGRLTETIAVDERAQSRKLVVEDVPARVLCEGEWMSIDLVDMSEKGFSFEVDRITGARFAPGQKLVFTLRIPELKEFSLYGRIQWKKPDEKNRQVRCGVEIIEVHGPGGGISAKELLRFLLEHQPRSYGVPQNPRKVAA